MDKPSADFNLSSATLGLRAPFSVKWAAGPNSVHTLCSLNILLSFRAPRRGAEEGTGLGPGPGVGRGGRGGGRTQRCAAGKFGSVCEDLVVHSHEMRFLSLDFYPGVCGVQGRTLAASW